MEAVSDHGGACPRLLENQDALADLWSLNGDGSYLIIDLRDCVGRRGLNLRCRLAE